MELSTPSLRTTQQTIRRHHGLLRHLHFVIFICVIIRLFQFSPSLLHQSSASISHILHLRHHSSFSILSISTSSIVCQHQPHYLRMFPWRFNNQNNGLRSHVGMSTRWLVDLVELLHPYLGVSSSCTRGPGVIRDSQDETSQDGLSRTGHGRCGHASVGNNRVLYRIQTEDSGLYRIHCPVTLNAVKWIPIHSNRIHRMPL
jgi:hypothetical protein